MGRVTGTGVSFYRSNGYGTWTHTGTISDFSPAHGYGNANAYPLVIGDFNGDGRTDVGRVTGSGVAFYLSNGDGTWTYMGVISGDFSPGQGYTDANTYPMVIGDFNGDGKTDVGRVIGSGVQFYLSNGCGGWTLAAGINDFSPAHGYTDAYTYPMVLGDFNGDGRTDVGRVTAAGVQFYVSNGGAGWTMMSGISSLSPGQGYDNADMYPLVEGDFNGDGKMDVGRVSCCGVELYKTTPSFSDLLTNMINTMGSTTTLQYASSSQYLNTLLPFILQTISRITINDGFGNASVTNYFYSGGLYDFAYREFRGFAYMRANHLDGSEGEEFNTQTWFLQDPILEGKPWRQIGTSHEGHTRRIDNQWSAYSLGYGAYHPRLNRTTWTNTDQGFSPYGYYTEYDYGAYLSIIHEHKVGSSAEEEMHTFASYANIGTYFLYKPTDVVVTDSSGNIVSRKWMDYDGAGNLITEEVCRSETPASGCASRNAAQNAITSYSYYPEGNIHTVTDPLGGVSSFTYDSSKLYPSQKVNALGHTISTEYDYRWGKPTSMVPAHLQGTGYAVVYQYDQFGRLLCETRPDGGYTSYQYLNLGSPTTQCVLKTEHIVGGASPLNHYSRDWFDGLGRVYWSSATGPSNSTVVIQTSFDALGRISSKSNPYLYQIDTPHYTTFTYDGLSRVVDTSSPDGYHTATSFQGLRKVVTDQNSHATVYTSDVYGRLKKVEDPQGTLTEYTYDNRGNLIRVVAAKGNTEQNTTTMTYDSLGKKRSMIDPDMGLWTYHYDKAGNLTSQTDAMGVPLGFAFDALNRVTQKIYPDHTVTYSYDNATIPYSTGMLTKVSDPSGGETKEDHLLQLDRMQRITKSLKSIGSNAVTTSRTYDSLGRTITLAYFPGSSSQRVFRYAYDAAGNLASLHDDTGSKDIVQYTNFTALGQARTATFPKPNNYSVQTTYTYNSLTSRIGSILTRSLQNGTPVATFQNLSYDQYDGKGNLLHLTDTQNSLSHSFTYDSLDRLLSADGTGANPYSQSYIYDRIGNITYKSDVGAYSYSYGNKPHAVRSAGSNITLQYDANGRMSERAVTGGATLDISWNAESKPTLIKKNNSDYISFSYDGSGKRVKKQNLWTGQSTLYFGEIYEKRGSVGVMHLFCGSQRVASIRTDANEQYYHDNHLSSASVVTNGNGTRKEQLEYFPFGSYHQKTDYDASFPNANYTFTDQEDDDELGLYNFKARLYDPQLGRFISADTIVQAPGDPQTLNRYSYCRNNPLMYTDPSGHFFFAFLIGALIGAIFAGIQSHWNLQSMLIGGFIGGISGGLFAEVSGAASVYISHITLAGAMGPPTPGMMLAGQIGGGIAGGAAAGASAGGLGAGFYGGNVFNGMLTGAGYGALGGGAFGAINGYYGSRWDLGRVGLSTLAGGGVAAISGGDFKEGALFAFGAEMAAYSYYRMVGYRVTWEQGSEAVEKGRYDYPIEGANNVGVQGGPVDPNGLWNEGGQVSMFGNNISGINAVASLHDTWQVNIDLLFGATARDVFSIPLMLPAAAITYSGLMTDMTATTLLAIHPGKYR